MSFTEDLDQLLSAVPSKVWQDRTICGVLYDIFPWHEYSALSLQTRECDERDPASWKYFEIARSSGELLSPEFSAYEQNESPKYFHFMLCQAAEALLAVDFSSYGLPETLESFHLYKPFQLQVFDPDRTFEFNYCEFILASRLEPDR